MSEPEPSPAALQPAISAQPGSIPAEAGEIAAGYAISGPAPDLGALPWDGQCHPQGADPDPAGHAQPICRRSGRWTSRSWFSFFFFIFDEAHRVFSGVSKVLLEAITQTVRLIRSKGVGVRAMRRR